MSAKHLFDKLAKMEMPQTDEPMVPPPELIGFFIRWVRGLNNWKRKTLADFSQVSVSTIERVERGEKVSDECLERIGQALGYERGYFTAPRRRKSLEETKAELLDTWGNLEVVNVQPLRTQNQLRKLANCCGCFVHRPGVGQAYDPDIDELTEWLDLASFIINMPIEGEDPSEGRRRELYTSILACVQRLERRGVTVLSGVMDAPQDRLPHWTVAIISITSKRSDPGASKRRAIFVDRRCVALPQMKAA